MDSNNMYQTNQGAGSDPENTQNPYSQNSGQNPYEQNAYQNPYGQEANQNAYQNPYGQEANQNAYQNPYGQEANQNAYQNPYGQDMNQNAYQNPAYQPYQYGGYNSNYQQMPQPDLEEPVKMSEWLITFLILMVPCVNIVMMFIWAFSKTEKKSKSNLFKAYLILCGIMLALYLIVVIIIVAAGIAFAG